MKRAFEQLGYENCETGDLEPEFEKIALYAKRDDDWKHAAKQDHVTGEWLSKLGDEYDVRHKTPHCLDGSIYGKVICFMKRRLIGA